MLLVREAFKIKVKVSQVVNQDLKDYIHLPHKLVIYSPIKFGDSVFFRSFPFLVKIFDDP